MKLTLGRLKKLINEARWRAWQYKNGGRVGEPVEVEADDDREAAQRAAEILKTYWMSVDTERIEDEVSVEKTELSPVSVSPVILSFGYNLTGGWYPGRPWPRPAVGSSAISQAINEVRAAGWEVTPMPSSGDPWEIAIYHPAHWTYSPTQPGTHYAVEAAGLGAVSGWLIAQSPSAQDLVAIAVNDFVSWGAYPTAADYIRFMQQPSNSMWQNYVLSASNIYEAWLSSGHSSSEANSLGKEILGIP